MFASKGFQSSLNIGHVGLKTRTEENLINNVVATIFAFIFMNLGRNIFISSISFIFVFDDIRSKVKVTMTENKKLV